MKKILSVIILLLTAISLGTMVGAVTAGFLHLVEWGQNWLWNSLTSSLPWQILLITVIGGILVGLCQKYLGDFPKGITEAIITLQKTGRLEYRSLPKGMLTAYVSLIAGASLGPEAALVDLLGGLGTWVGDLIRSLRDRLQLPIPQQFKNRVEKTLQRWPNLLALAAGALALIKLLNGLYSGGFLSPNEPFQWIDLAWSVPLAALGAAAGALFLFMQSWTRRLATPLEHKPILRGASGGILLGVAALGLPMILFSGQHLLQPAYEQYLQIGFVTLFLTALARFLMTNILLATGWKGGQFLPMMFGATALGLSVSALFPAIPAATAALAVMGALVAVVLPKPWIALVLMALMFPIQYVGVSIVSVGLVVIGKQVKERRQRKKTAMALSAEA
jgi:H+/Cl- antiporter ClcA